jgi:hypothetical protein
MKAPTRRTELLIILLLVVDTAVLAAAVNNLGFSGLAVVLAAVGAILTVTYLALANRAIRHARAFKLASPAKK